MSGLADTVRSKLASSCLVDGVDSIDKGNCGASLVDTPHPKAIVDLDKTGAPQGGARTKCDFLFFADPNFVTPIEIKDHGSPDIAKATRQLQAGANAAGELTPRDLTARFRPVLVCRDMRRDKQNELRRATVRFRKQRPEIVRQVICGNPLTEALSHS